MPEWPPLPFADWSDTRATLHMWTQVVGKVKLALAPPVNHWWHVTLTTTARGLTTAALPYDGRTIELSFDFVDHQLVVDCNRGDRRLIELRAKSVSQFYGEVMRALAELGAPVRIWPMPVEIESPVRFDRDELHASYDRQAVERWWVAMTRADEALKRFRSGFIGKSSPVHFFWGSFDLAVTRFSGRRAPARPNADRVTAEAYSHEVSSAGFWPGNAAYPHAAFYSYAAPEPDGFKAAAVGPSAAGYDPSLGEFLLRYDDVRALPDPAGAVQEFLTTTYDAAAVLGGWDRAHLERT